MRMRQLEAFRATILGGSVTRAALTLKTSQPTLSRLLSELERSLGFALFARKKGRIVPTEEGLQFYEQLDEVYEAFSHLRTVADDIKRDRNKRLKIVGSSALTTSLLPAVLARFNSLHPDVEISLHAQTIPELFRSLLRSEADLVFTNKLGGVQDMAQQHLITTSFVCALPPGHPLTEKATIHVDDLKGEKVIRLEDADNLGFAEHDQLIEKHDWWQHAPVATQISNVAYSLVLRGIGIGLLEPFSAPLWEAQGVEIRPFWPRLNYEFTACYSPKLGNTNLARRFLELTKQYISELQLPD